MNLARRRQGEGRRAESCCRVDLSCNATAKEHVLKLGHANPSQIEAAKCCK